MLTSNLLKKTPLNKLLRYYTEWQSFTERARERHLIVSEEMF
jgi:hypothetical protein